MKTPDLTSAQYRRFENHVSYARRNGAALYNAQAPETLINGDDDDMDDAALLAAGLFYRNDGYYTFTQAGWDYARYLRS